MFSNPERVGNSGERRIHCADARKETGVHDVKVVEFVRLAINVEHGGFRIGAEAAGAGLVADAGEGNLFSLVCIIRNEVRVLVQVLQHEL